MSEKALSVHRLVLELFPESKVSLKYKMPTYEIENVWFTIGNQKQYLMSLVSQEKANYSRNYMKTQE